jgi:hypothetical protein
MASEFILGSGASHKLEFAVKRNGGGAAEIEWLSTAENFKSVVLLARGEAELVMKPKSAPLVEISLDTTPLDTIVRVDRSIRPVYPNWMKKVMHPDLENTGPEKYDLAEVVLWLHEDQRNGGSAEADKIYRFLKDTGMMRSCLALRDGEEIQKKGVAIFRKLFERKVVFLWKSVVLSADGNLLVPYIFFHGDKLPTEWARFDGFCYGCHVAARFTI